MSETPPPLRVREADGSPSLIPTYVMTFSGATLTRRGPTEMLIQMDSGASGGGAPTDAVYLVGVADATLSAERVVRAVSGLLIDSTNAGFFDIGLVTPVSVASGGIGTTTLTAFGVLYGSGGSAIQATPAMSGGAILIGSGVNFRPHVLNTAGQGQYLVTSAGPIGGLAWANTLGPGGVVYAPTAGSYVAFETDATLTNERVLSGGSSATVVTDGSFVYVTAITAGFTTSARVITTLFPMSGGANFSADRTFAVNTAFLVTSSRTISFGSALFSGGGNLGADRTITIGTPIGTGSGGTGISDYLPWQLFRAGSSTLDGFVQMPYMTVGDLIVGSSPIAGSESEPFLLSVGSPGQVLGIVNAQKGSVAWITTGAGGAGATYAATGNQYVTLADAADLTADRVLAAGTGLYLTDLGAGNNVLFSMSSKTVRIPLALATVQPDSANAFWTAKSGSIVDYGYVAFADSGNGAATWWGLIPTNVHSSPLWSIELWSSPDSGNGGNTILSMSAKVVGQLGSIDATYTNMVSVGTFFINTSNIMTVTTMSATNFDSTLTVGANSMLFVEIIRHGGLVSDTLSAQWDVLATVLRINVI